MLASNLSPVVIERDVCDSLKCLLSFAAHFREDESALSVAQSLALSVQQPAFAKKTGELHSSGICIWQWPSVVSQAAVLFPFEVRGCEIGMRGRDGTGGMSSGGETEVH